MPYVQNGRAILVQDRHVALKATIDVNAALTREIAIVLRVDIKTRQLNPIVKGFMVISLPSQAQKYAGDCDISSQFPCHQGILMDKLPGVQVRRF